MSEKDYFILSRTLRGVQQKVRQMNCGEDDSKKEMRSEMLGYIKGLREMVDELYTGVEINE